MKNFYLIFHSNGGITLQTDNYCHHFVGRENEAAECAFKLLDLATNTEYWDGNEPGNRVVYDAEIERVGGYRWVSNNEIDWALFKIPVKQRDQYLDCTGGSAEREFFRYLFMFNGKAE